MTGREGRDHFDPRNFQVTLRRVNLLFQAIGPRGYAEGGYHQATGRMSFTGAFNQPDPPHALTFGRTDQVPGDPRSPAFAIAVLARFARVSSESGVALALAHA